VLNLDEAQLRKRYGCTLFRSLGSTATFGAFILLIGRWTENPRINGSIPPLAPILMNDRRNLLRYDRQLADLVVVVRGTRH
jgi:hypothetical protein